MKRILSLIVFLSAVAVMLAGCGSDSTPLAPNDTSALNSQSIEVAFSIPADATIDEVMFYVHSFVTNTQAVTVHEVTSSWEETTITWANFGAAFMADPIDTIHFTDTGWYAVDVTSSARSWFDSTMENYGFFLQSAVPGIAPTILESREADSNNPFLVVCYSTHEGSSCDTLAASADAYIFSADSTTNLGAETSLTVGIIPETELAMQTIIQFEFPIEIRYGSIGNRVWVDLNADGIQDEDEFGFEDIQVNLYNCEESLLATTTTNSTGYYSFGALMAGGYVIEVVGVEGYMFSPMDVGSDETVDSDVDPLTGISECFDLPPGALHIGLDAGLFPVMTSIGDFVWNDENMNGLQDEGEEGLGDIVVRLYDCEGEMVAETISDENGAYMFDMVKVGEHYLEFVNPNGYVFTYQDVGDDDAIDSDVDRYTKRTACFTPEPGQEGHIWDAGLFAFDGCTYSKGYWKNHAGFGPQDDVLSKFLPIWLGNDDGGMSMAVDNAQMAVDILSQKVFGHPSNGITKLCAQLLAAKLNIANFANPEDIEDVISDADDFLADYSYMDWEMLDKDQRNMVLEWKDMLDQYNNGMIGPGHCDEEDISADGVREMITPVDFD